MKHFLGLLRILGKLGTKRAVLLVLALFLNSLLEGFGIATLVPLVVLAMGQDGSAMPPIAAHVFELMERLGLPREVWLLTLVAAGALVLREIINFAILAWSGFAITDMEARLQRRMLRSIVRAEWPWYHDNRLGDMSISLVNYTGRAAVGMMTAVRAVAMLMRTLVYLALVVLISPMLALLVLIASIVLFGPLFLLVKLIRRYSNRHAAYTSDLSARFADAIASIKMFKAMGLEERMQPLLERLIMRMRKFHRRIMVVTHGLAALQNILGIILIFSTLLLAVNWVGISMVEIGVVAGLVLSVARNFSKSQLLMQKVAQQAPYLRRVEHLIESASQAREDRGGRIRPVLERSLELCRVSFSHPGKPVLQDVDMHFRVHGINVLVGPSGAGKTTVIDLVTGLQVPQSGRICIDGIDLRDIDLQAWRHMIGYVPQELILLSGSVRENITLGGDYSDEDIWHALQLAGAEGFVRDLPNGLDTQLGERGVKLSGGQRQRLSLARALVRGPRLLILDEVTSALDPDTERQLVNSISELARREGLTIIAITHNDAWHDVADEVLRLENGKVQVEQPPSPAPASSPTP